MNSEPCAKLMIRVRPRISDSPDATRNSNMPFASPAINWRVMTTGSVIQDNDWSHASMLLTTLII